VGLQHSLIRETIPDFVTGDHNTVTCAEATVFVVELDISNDFDCFI
jgi:hypothetical protein